ncbi:hypothetical protein ACNF40_01035 [Cuniculiplasma sp. SKW4]|uniref:hypothetical protein n=1 Tax=Cuniculiplasma sp. SKW4 TaxID=3400171 RepID=UPI003FD640D5
MYVRLSLFSGAKTNSPTPMEQNDIMNSLPATMTWKLTGSTCISDISGITTLNIDMNYIVRLYPAEAHPSALWLNRMEDHGGLLDTRKYQAQEHTHIPA